MCELIKENKVHFGSDETSVPCQKTYLKDTEYKSLTSLIFKDGRAASKRLKSLFGESVFTNPKDDEVLYKLISAIGLKNDDIFMDFFAGSGTSAHALWRYNIQKNVRSKFILVQLPENLFGLENSATGLSKKIIGNAIMYLNEKKLPPSISEICKQRIKLTGDLLRPIGGNIDFGVRIFKLHPSNFKIWETGDNQTITESIKLFSDHIDFNAKPEDILYEILLKDGFELTTTVVKIILEGKEIYSIEDGAMFIYLGDVFTKELSYAIAEKAPSRFVCLDHSFHYNDQLKTNTVQLMKSRNIKFRTV